MSDIDRRKIFARNFVYFMKVQERTRHEVSADLDVPYRTVCDWANAKKYPRPERMEQIARYFGIKMSILVEENEREFYSCSVTNKIKLLRIFDDMNETGQERLVEQAEFLYKKHKKSDTVSDIAE